MGDREDMYCCAGCRSPRGNYTSLQALDYARVRVFLLPGQLWDGTMSEMAILRRTQRRYASPCKFMHIDKLAERWHLSTRSVAGPGWPWRRESSFSFPPPSDSDSSTRQNQVESWVRVFRVSSAQPSHKIGIIPTLLQTTRLKGR